MVLPKPIVFFVREYEEKLIYLPPLPMRSMAYGSEGENGLSKSLWVKTGCLVRLYLCFLAKLTVGSTTSTLKSVPSSPRGGASHTRQIIDLLGTTCSGRRDGLRKSFSRMHPQLKKRGLVVIVSDSWGHSLDP